MNARSSERAGGARGRASASRVASVARARAKASVQRASQRERANLTSVNAKEFVDDVALVRAKSRASRSFGRNEDDWTTSANARAATGYALRDLRATAMETFKNPLTIAFVIASLASFANPTFMTSGREAILMKLYERESEGRAGAYVRDGVLYRVDASTGTMTANARDGVMVDPRGGIWVVVPQKFDETLIKEKYYMGQIEDVPSLSGTPTKEELKRYDEYMAKTFKPLFEDLPDLKKVYDGKYPVPMRKETMEFERRGGFANDGEVRAVEIVK